MGSTSVMPRIGRAKRIGTSRSTKTWHLTTLRYQTSRTAMGQGVFSHTVGGVKRNQYHSPLAQALSVTVQAKGPLSEPAAPLFLTCRPSIKRGVGPLGNATSLPLSLNSGQTLKLRDSAIRRQHEVLGRPIRKACRRLARAQRSRPR